MKKKKMVKMTFEVNVPFDIMRDEDSLKNDFDGDIYKMAKWLFEEEGLWFSEGEMKIIKAKIY